MNQVLPLWTLIAIAVATPMLAFGGSLIGQVIARKAAREQEVRWQREESMRMLRWSAELSVDSRTERAAMGAVALRALSRSALLHPLDAVLIDSLFDLVLQTPAADYNDGDDAEVS